MYGCILCVDRRAFSSDDGAYYGGRRAPKLISLPNCLKNNLNGHGLYGARAGADRIGKVGPNGQPEKTKTYLLNAILLHGPGYVGHGAN